MYCTRRLLRAASPLWSAFCQPGEERAIGAIGWTFLTWAMDLAHVPLLGRLFLPCFLLAFFWVTTYLRNGWSPLPEVKIVVTRRLFPRRAPQGWIRPFTPVGELHLGRSAWDKLDDRTMIHFGRQLVGDRSGWPPMYRELVHFRGITDIVASRHGRTHGVGAWAAPWWSPVSWLKWVALKGGRLPLKLRAWTLLRCQHASRRHWSLCVAKTPWLTVVFISTA